MQSRILPVGNPGSLTDLPPPDPVAQAHSNRLLTLIRHAIASAGDAISFARFMELALHAPGLGYYSAGSHKFGAAGDFVTAPELSPLFGRCVANQCAEVLNALGKAEVLEAGGGSGALAAQLLLAFEAMETTPERYCILELSAELKERQRQTLAERAPHLLERVEWLTDFPAYPWRGVVVANEVLDAMPVHRFHREADGVAELYVTWQDGRLAIKSGPASMPSLVKALEALSTDLDTPLPAGYTSEISLAAPGWIKALAEFLDSGLVLLIDYGFPRREYYHPQRGSGTLMCHYRHRVHADPLLLPGLQDITAHLDFTALAAAAVEVGLRVAGYTSQSHFLINTGLPELVASSDPGEVLSHVALSQQVSVLTSPAEMGELFKVLALTRGLDMPLRGFAHGDRRAGL